MKKNKLIDFKLPKYQNCTFDELFNNLISEKDPKNRAPLIIALSTCDYSNNEKKKLFDYLYGEVSNPESIEAYVFGSSTVAKFAAMAIIDNGTDVDIKKLEDIIIKSWNENEKFTFNRYCEALNIKPINIQ